MKNFKKLKLLSFLALLFMIFIYACSVDLVEPDSDGFIENRLDEDCQFFITGQVIDSKTSEAIKNARIFSEDLDVDILSDNDGRFLFHVAYPIETFFGTRKRIEVTKNNYVISTLEIDFIQFYFPRGECKDTYTEVELDFVLTKKQACHTVDEGGTSFSVSKTSIHTNAIAPFTNIRHTPLVDFVETTKDTIIDDFQVIIPADAVSGPTDICVTPLSDDQYLGLLKDLDGIVNTTSQDIGTSVMRFDFQPSGQTFDKKITISFKITENEASAGDQLDYYVRNPVTNIWEVDETADLSFNPSTNIVTLKTDHFSQGLILNNSARIEVDDIQFSGPQTILSSNTFNTCNCEDELDISFNQDFEQLDQQFSLETSTSSQNKLLKRLRSVKTLLNIAASKSSAHLEYFAASSNFDFPTLRTYEKRTVDAAGKILKCEITVITAALQYKIITGHIDDLEFSYRSYAGMIVKSPKFRCPTTSLCHQGCPE